MVPVGAEDPAGCAPLPEACGTIGTIEDDLALLKRVAPEGNWSVEKEEGWSYLFTGDQWVLRTYDQVEFGALMVGTAAVAALLPQ